MPQIDFHNRTKWYKKLTPGMKRCLNDAFTARIEVKTK